MSVRTFVIPFYYGSGSAKVRNKIRVPVPPTAKSYGSYGSGTLRKSQQFCTVASSQNYLSFGLGTFFTHFPGWPSQRPLRHTLRIKQSEFSAVYRNGSESVWVRTGSESVGTPNSIRNHQILKFQFYIHLNYSPSWNCCLC